MKLDTVSSPYSISPEKLPKASTRQLLVDAVIGSYQPEFGARLENLIHETSLSELNGYVVPRSLSSSMGRHTPASIPSLLSPNMVGETAI